MESKPEKGLSELASQVRKTLETISQENRNKYLKLGDAAVLRALIQAIPWVGGSLDTLIFTKAESIKRSHVLDYVDALKEYMLRINVEKIDKQFFETEYGLSVFETALRAAVSESIKEKRKILAAVTVNSGTITLSKRDDHQFILEYVSRMSISQIIAFLEIAGEQARIANERKRHKWGRIWFSSLGEFHYQDVMERARRALEKQGLTGEVAIEVILDGLIAMNLIAFPESVDPEEGGGTLQFSCLVVTELGGSVYEYLELYPTNLTGDR